MKHLITFLSAIIITSNIAAQVAPPQAFNYSAVVRNADGSILANQNIGIQFSILIGSITGAVQYQENQTTKSNQFGLATLSIGAGMVQQGIFDSINWGNNNYYLQVGIDTSGGTNFQTISTTQLLSVPYALYANSAGSVSGGGGFAHYIGELYGGGIVIAVWKVNGVEHGLIASLTDLSTAQIWSNIDTTLIGPSAESFTDGLDNTNAIIAQAGQTTSAALLCHNYTGGGYNDWYLPSIYELLQCYNELFIINKILGPTNGFAGNYYWSSTESNGDNAWNQGFGNGDQYNYYGKDATGDVRAVRGF